MGIDPSAQILLTAMELEQSLLTRTPLAIAVVMGWVVLWRGGFGLSWKRAIVVDLVMNVVVVAAGILALTLVSLIDAYFPWSPFHGMFESVLFYAVMWGGGFVTAVLATTLVEAGVIRLFRAPLGWRRFRILCAANTVSATVGLGVVFAGSWMPLLKR